MSFKVINNGRGIGEEFININNNVNEIYVTIFDKNKSLIKLLNNNGYYEYLGSKSDNKELVLVKRRND